MIKQKPRVRRAARLKAASSGYTVAAMNLIHRLLSAFLLSCFLPAFITAQQPEMYVQRAHAGEVRSVAYSPDGRLIASGSDDGTVRLWDVQTRAVVRTLGGHPSAVTALLFVTDKHLLSGSSRVIKSWDVTTGKVAREIPAPSLVTSLSLSSDRKYLAVAAWDVALVIDLEKRETKTFSNEGRRIYCVAFRPHQTMLAAGSDGAILVWDAATGREIVKLDRMHMPTAHVKALAFSPDGKIMASGGADFLIITDIETSTYQKKNCTPNSLAFSPDGQLLASANLENTVGFWDVATRTEKRRVTVVNAEYLAVAFSPDGKSLAGGGREVTKETVGLRPRLHAWDVATGDESVFNGAQATSLEALALSPDGKTLSAAGDDKKIRLWDLAAGRGDQTLGDHEGHVIGLAYNADGKLLASTGLFDGVRFWDLAARRELPRAEDTTDEANAKPQKPTPKPPTGGAANSPADRLRAGFEKLAEGVGRLNDAADPVFSPDGQMLTTNKNKTIELRNVKTGRTLHTLAGHETGIYVVAFSPDSRLVVSGSDDGLTKLWDTATGRELRTLAPHRASVRSLAFSPDGKILASGSNDRTVRLWEVETGRLLRTLSGYGDYVRSVVFSPDGKLLAHGGLGITALVWDVATGRRLYTLAGHSGDVPSVAFSANGQFLFTGSKDATVKLWRTRDGAEAAMLVATGKSDWLVVTPDGLFDGSPAAWRQIIWRFGGNFSHAPVEAFFSDFYRPGLLADILSGRGPRAEVNIARKDIRQPSVTITQGASGAARRNVTLRVEVKEAAADGARSEGSGAQDVRLFRNGSLVRVWRGDVLKGRPSATLEAPVSIVAGENRFTAYAFNRENVKSGDATLVIEGGESLKRPAVAHILAVGVNSYANPRYNLKYAVADARVFAEEFKKQQEKLRRYARIEVTTLLDKQATKANILGALAALAAKAQPEDAVVVYFAGHGTAQENRFYLIPHDLGYMGERDGVNEFGLNEIITHSVSDIELEQAFEKLDAGQLLMVIDACNSGQALEAEEKRRGPMNSKGLAQLAYEKGMYVLTAAQSFQAAQEASQLGHGLLTYALIEEGLKRGMADTQAGDGGVLVREWLDYATGRVPEMQLNEMERALARGTNLSFAEEERGLTVDKRSGQRPRVFYRREPAPQPLVVAAPTAK